MVSIRVPHVRVSIDTIEIVVVDYENMNSVLSKYANYSIDLLHLIY